MWDLCLLLDERRENDLRLSQMHDTVAHLYNVGAPVIVVVIPSPSISTPKP